MMRRYAAAALLIAIIPGLFFCKKKHGHEMEKQLRTLMIKNQITSRGISDKRLIEALESVERHLFIPGGDITEAYADHPLPIGHGQTISQPYIVALMTELCELSGNERVLEIGTGSGYQTALLAKLAKEVFTIEIIAPLAKGAMNRLTEMGYKNIKFRTGDGYAGWREGAPFDVIILTAAPPEIPGELINQLSVNGGILIAPVGSHQQELVKIKKNSSSITKEFVTYVRFVPMVKQDPEEVNGK